MKSIQVILGNRALPGGAVGKAVLIGMALFLLFCARANCESGAAPSVEERPKLQAKGDIVIRDTARGDYLVWMDVGKSDGVTPGMSFDILIKDEPAGTVWVEEALEHTSAGYITAFKGARNISSGQVMTLIKKDIQAIQVFPDIKLPSKGLEIPAVPEAAASQSEKSLLREFLKWSQKTSTPIGTLVPADKLPEPSTQGSVAKAPEPEEKLFEYEIVAIDPDIATEVKSGYFIEEGDCVHIAPWPDSDTGQAVIIGKEMKLNYPGGAMFLTKGKTLLSLEKAISDYLVEKGTPSKVAVSPCRLKTPPPAAR